MNYRCPSESKEEFPDPCLAATTPKEGIVNVQAYDVILRQPYPSEIHIIYNDLK